MTNRRPRLAFVSTRIAGTDGVSLEVSKWTDVLERMGVDCYYIAGAVDRPADRSIVIDEMHFEDPEVLNITNRAFGREERSATLSDAIILMAKSIRDQIEDAIEEFELDAIIAENALTIPMNLPLGIALVQAIQDTRIGCVAHHHDFYWERDRFMVNSVRDFLCYAFPPALPQIQHVVINSPQAEEFSRRTGLSCRIIPNVMDFAHPPEEPDEYARAFRAEVGLDEDELFVLQPTRVVARKGIEHAVELVRRLGRKKACLVISHASGDEGGEYAERIRDYAGMMGVRLLFVDEWIATKRGVSSDGRPLFTLGDVFSQADLVTYPSEYEGFGNAFLEAIYHKKPVVCNRYLIYRTDIEPCGFDTVCFDGYLTHATVARVNDLLESTERRRQMVEQNYQIARTFFSYEVLESELRLMVERPQNIYRMLGRGKYHSHARLAGNDDPPI